LTLNASTTTGNPAREPHGSALCRVFFVQLPIALLACILAWVCLLVFVVALFVYAFRHWPPALFTLTCLVTGGLFAWVVWRGVTFA